MRIHLSSWQRLLGAILSLLSVSIFFAAVIVLSPVAGSSPGSSAIIVSTATPLFSAESLCDQAFPLRLDTSIAPEKRTFQETEYQRCVQARKSAEAGSPQTPDFSNRPSPKATFGAAPTAVVPRTTAGAGTILESDASPLGPLYVIENSWVFETQGRKYQVYAGAQREEGPPQSRNTMQGIVVVWVWANDGNPMSGGGTYNVPSKKGPVRIVGAQGQRLILKTDDSSTFYFDVPARRFVSSLTESVPAATLSAPATPRAPAYP